MFDRRLGSLLVALVTSGCANNACPAGDVGCEFASMTISDFLAGGGNSIGGPLETLTSIDPTLLAARVAAATTNQLQLTVAGSLTYASAGDGALLGLQWTDPNGCRPGFCMSACPKGVECIAARCAPSARDGLTRGFTEDWVTYGKTTPAPLDFDLKVVAVSAMGCPADVTAAIASATSQVAFSQVITVPVNIDSGGGGGGGAGGGGGGSGSTWYLHWQCGSSSQCASAFGGSVGIQTSFSTQAACLSVQTMWANNNTMQPYNSASGVGDWCSTSGNSTDAHP